MSERAVTEDALFEGRIRFFQPASGNGYRANVDALLLGAVRGRGDRMARRAVDLGAGAGAVGLTLLYLGIAEQRRFHRARPLRGRALPKKPRRQ